MLPHPASCLYGDRFTKRSNRFVSEKAFDTGSQLAQIGVGGMGGSDRGNLINHKSVQFVGLCDVDKGRLQGAAKGIQGVKTFDDYREMFANLGDQLDAVVVSTPDHTHAPASVSAMNLGKHVYCQKPLAHEVFETRVMRELAAEKKLVTQMGIQIHSHIAYRMATAMIQSGAIGKVKEVVAWSNKNWGYDGGPITGSDPVPENLNWEQWIGTADMRPFVNGKYHPSQWRKLIDFGTGTLGDMGVHIFDTPFRALKLTAPKWVKTECRAPTGVGHPSKNEVQYEFPETEYTTKGFLWTWADGGYAPPKGKDWPIIPGTKLPAQGAMFIGEEGHLLLPHIGGPQLLPREKFQGRPRPELKKNVDHYHQWVDTILGKDTCSANFEYAGKLSESLLLGVVANRFPGEKLTWDFDKMQVTNKPEANALLRRTYRKGFEVKGLS